MPVVMSGNLIFVGEGEKAFRVASNLTNYLELGLQGITSYHLEAKVDGGEFLINAKIPSPHNGDYCRITNNFPEASGYRRELTPHGFHILSNTGELVLGIEVRDQVCLLRGRIYDAAGNTIAEDRGEDFLIYQGPAVIGKSSSGALGIVLK